MRLLIGITSCQYYEDKGYNDHSRNTWLEDARSMEIDCRFFIGIGKMNRADVVTVNAGDDYASLAYKNYQKFCWAYEQGYDHMFNADADTYASVARLLWCGYEKFDYFGDFLHEEPRQPYPHASYGCFCQEGPGYFISRRAMKACIDDLPARFAQGQTDFDPLVGEVCRAHSELLIGDGSWRRFTTHWEEHDPGPRKDNEIVSCHLSTLPPAKEEWAKSWRMYRLHNEWKKSMTQE